MANTIQIRRGAKSSLPTLNAGELAFCTDTKQVYIGDGSTNYEILLSSHFVGEIREGFWTASPDADHWILLYGTLGNATSGADYADAKYEDLYTHLWDTLADTYAPVSSGRGASAAADFAANKTLTMPDGRGRTIIGAGQGSGLTNRVLGSILGEEGHGLTDDENGPHTHTFAAAFNTVASSLTHRSASGSNTTFTTSSSGSGTPHNTMQPSLVVAMIIAYQ